LAKRPETFIRPDGCTRPLETDPVPFDCLYINKATSDPRSDLLQFDLQAFHDSLMTSGRLPLSLLRWEMTGLDDEARRFWKRDPIPD
jgi:hypothetical protein